jgi:hypothetical protein
MSSSLLQILVSSGNARHPRSQPINCPRNVSESPIADARPPVSPGSAVQRRRIYQLRAGEASALSHRRLSSFDESVGCTRLLVAESARSLEAACKIYPDEDKRRHAALGDYAGAGPPGKGLGWKHQPHWHRGLSWTSVACATQSQPHQASRVNTLVSSAEWVYLSEQSSQRHRRIVYGRYLLRCGFIWQPLSCITFTQTRIPGRGFSSSHADHEPQNTTKERAISLCTKTHVTDAPDCVCQSNNESTRNEKPSFHLGCGALPTGCSPNSRTLIDARGICGRCRRASTSVSRHRPILERFFDGSHPHDDENCTSTENANVTLGSSCWFGHLCVLAGVSDGLTDLFGGGRSLRYPFAAFTNVPRLPQTVPWASTATVP